MKYCGRCILPIKEPSKKNLCLKCNEVEQDKNFGKYFGKNNLFQEEFKYFLYGKKEVVFAYSGGLDSTVVLHNLNKICREKEIKLNCFTLDHGFKGSRTKKNIFRIIDSFGLKDSFSFVDISQKKIKNKEKIFDYYKNLLGKNILPCGSRCNEVIDTNYKKILNSFGETILITGGDTPKFNKNLGRFSLFWEQPLFVVLRGGIAFGLSKDINEKYIKKNQIPWENPGCGGYDTDCLIPGAILRKTMENKKYNFEEIKTKIPVLIDYLSERVRWEIIERKKAFSQISKIEFADDFSYDEFTRICEQ